MPKQSILAIMLAANRNGLQLKYTRNADGSEVLEPFTLTSDQIGAPIPPHANQDIKEQFARRIHNAQRRS
ncbi:MAG: hypothetical protein ACOVN5_08555 [Aquidulcibacter sp.]